MMNILTQYGLVCLSSFSCFLYLNSYFNIIILLATMTLNQVQSFRINHQAGSHYINI